MNVTMGLTRQTNARAFSAPACESCRCTDRVDRLEAGPARHGYPLMAYSIGANSP